MKALLTINGDSYLIPKTTDLNKIIDLFQGVQRVRQKDLWGPDSARYEDGLHVSREVLADAPERVRVELVPDGDVVSRAEWDALEAAHAKRVAEFNAKQVTPAKNISAGG